MAYKVQLSKRVIKYLKKIKIKKLKQLFLDTIYDKLSNNPYLGNGKTGDLQNYYAVGFRYNKVTYRIAYVIEDDQLIIIILAGTHEGFYRELKRIINRKAPQ